ncbi:hypothetical protein E3Q10_04248 [Wallemia mellicola]|nr:hypothetical protein E3Q24_04223 [Wallemia mellicola]TIB78940.1 hypothetical protein E3Q21_04292 [Wallemia mellicola]TIB83212.1 hypothetical protein E3Q20_04253 [Wallemia mellicola]TIB85506.1 hypothetical protein E3Q19_04202 [Wallemia mellicola]TIB95599.1 hypothetical protein E3Q17_04229 [Wallemia mellicola]
MNSLARTLANEEKDITTIAIRPGVVDTSMQQFIRDNGNNAMLSEEYKKFISLHSEKKLLSPDQPAKVFSNLSVVKLSGQHSGAFLSWDSNEFEEFRN